MLEMGLFGLAKVITSKRLAARSGFAAPKTAAVKAPARDDAAAARAAEQEAKVATPSRTSWRPCAARRGSSRRPPSSLRASSPSN